MTSPTAAGDPRSPAEPDAAWRIDELARRSGLTVDTIRFYQREGLLHPPERSGRTALYRPSHLARLGQVRELQARHLSLAAISALLATPSAGVLDALFEAGGRDYSREELIAATGVSPGFLDDLDVVGLLGRAGGDGYDERDLRVLQALERLLELGIPPAVVTRLGEIFATGFERMQGEVLELLQGNDGAGLDEGATDVRALMAQHVEQVLDAMAVVLDHCHHRSAQRLTLRSLGNPPVTSRRDAGT